MSFHETIANLTQPLRSYVQRLVLLWGIFMSQIGYYDDTIREILGLVSTG